MRGKFTQPVRATRCFPGGPLSWPAPRPFGDPELRPSARSSCGWPYAGVVGLLIGSPVRASLSLLRAPCATKWKSALIIFWWDVSSHGRSGRSATSGGVSPDGFPGPMSPWKGGFAPGPLRGRIIGTCGWPLPSWLGYCGATETTLCSREPHRLSVGY